MLKPTNLIIPALAIAVVGVSLIYSAVPAEAGRKSCLFQAFDRFANRTVHDIKGHGKAAKKSWACNRARRKCQRALRKAWDRGLAQRAGCVRFEGRVPQF